MESVPSSFAGFHLQYTFAGVALDEWECNSLVCRWKGNFKKRFERHRGSRKATPGFQGDPISSLKADSDSENADAAPAISQAADDDDDDGKEWGLTKNNASDIDYSGSELEESDSESDETDSLSETDSDSEGDKQPTTPVAQRFRPVPHLPLHKPFGESKTCSCNIIRALKAWRDGKAVFLAELAPVLLSDMASSTLSKQPVRAVQSAAGSTAQENPQEGNLPVQVVCKFAWSREARKRLDREAKVYKKFEAPQSVHIPQFFGCFEGDTNLGEARCVVMSYVGEPIDVELRFLNKPAR